MRPSCGDRAQLASVAPGNSTEAGVREGARGSEGDPAPALVCLAWRHRLYGHRHPTPVPH